MTNIEVAPAEIAQIVEAVFENMLRLEVRPCPEPWRAAAGRLTAAVGLSGAWNGSVQVECDRSQAREFARRYISSSDSSLGGDAGSKIDDDVAGDLLGELVNMIGGNWKCVLGHGIHLSAPAVNEACANPAPDIVERLSFRSSEGLFWVTVLAPNR